MSEVQANQAIVIVGGGHAAAQLCAALAEAKLGAQVHLVCEENELPYQRPPLSKAFLKNPEEGVQLHRSAEWFAEAGISVHLGQTVVAIDRAKSCVRLASGQSLPYGRLVLATGARPRSLPGLRDGLSNVALLRNAADARTLRQQLTACERVTVLGGGFIGLEVAATARAFGKAVTVLEVAPRLLGRSVSSEVAEHVLATHRASGIDVRLGVDVGAAEVEGDRVVALTVNGQREAVDLLVLGIGAVPEQSLAEAAGLACDNGIVVDACMRTSDPAILAIGDCTSFPSVHGGRQLRLESVQNANDQARTAVATLQGREEPYKALPWFWSEQGSMRLQMVGLMPVEGQRHRRPGANAASFSILHYVDERLVCVESVNASLDHITSRKLMEAGKHPAPTLACDPATPLKSLL